MAAQFEQSMLDGKDKEQLIAIAQALGIKANARMARPTLIAKILEATGVVDEAPAAASADAPPAGSTAGAEASSTPAAETPVADVERRDDVTTGEAAADDATADDDDDESDDDGDGEPGADTGDGEGDGEGGARRRRRRRRKTRSDASGADRLDAPPSIPKIEGALEFVAQEPVEVAGLLDLREEGYGFLRVAGYLATRDDAYVSLKLVRQYGLRRGDHVSGLCRAANRSEKNPALLEIHTVNGADPELARSRPRFDDLTAQYPDAALALAGPDADDTARLVDLVAPIGKGQRGLIVAGPGVERTSVVTALAAAIERNHPDVVTRVLLLDERPEDVTEVRRAVGVEVVASSFDRPADEHTLIAEVVVEQAKRQVEAGDDVVLIVDGLTRLGRAYLATSAAERSTGYVDTASLQPLKRFFGAARALAEGGSLTIIATLSCGTESRTDDMIAEEILGLQNWELRLDRGLSARGLLPPVDLTASGTAHAERFVEDGRVEQVAALRREVLATGDSAAALAELLRRLAATSDDIQLLGGR